MPTFYSLLTTAHVACVAVSGAGFALRGMWMMQRSPLLAHRWVRVAPHVVDTALLASAVALSLTIEQYPLTHGWLTAKAFGLVAYILLGSIALKRGRTLRIRTLAFCGALLAFAYIVAAAITKSAVPYDN